MSLLKKSLINFLVITVLIVLLILAVPYYFFYTEGGNKNLNKLLSYSATNQVGLEVDIQSLNLDEYPYVTADILVDNKYKVYLHGFLSDLLSERKFDMQYTIKGNAIQNDIIRVKSPLDIKGTLKGKRKYTELTGEGKILDGNVSYNLVKERKVYMDVDLKFNEINSTKLLKLLEQKPIFGGKADAHLHLDYFHKKKRKGTLQYSVKDKNFHGHDIEVDINVNLNDEKHTFTIDANTSELQLKLADGIYDEQQKYANAAFDLNVSDLSAFKKELGEEYLGRFDAKGVITYDDHLLIQGKSKSFEGLLAFDLNNTLLHVDIMDIPFTSFLKRMSISPSIEANTIGHINYNIEKREMDSLLTLQNTKILPSELSDTLLDKLGYDILNDSFTKSTIEANLKDNIFSSKIILANDKHHLILKDTQMDTEKKLINTYIDLKTPLHFLEGRVFARIDEYITKDVYLKFDGLVEKYYALKLDGLINEELINMDYSLDTQRFPSHLVTIEDNVSIQGHLNGPFTNLRIRGKGRALDGEVRFDAIKKSDHLENVKIRMRDIHALKLSTLLGYPTLPHGKAHINGDFSYLSKDKYQGKLDYKLTKSKYEGLPLSLEIHVQGDEKQQQFKGDIQLANADINLTKGLRDSNTTLAKAFFIVDAKDLTELEPILGAKYTGEFYAMGNVSYKDDIQIRGLTKTFGGMIDFLYKDELLIIDVDRSSLKRILSLFTAEPLVDATSIGHINYDYKKKLLLVDAKLKNARFIPSGLAEDVYKKSRINLLRENFDNSSVQARYQNKILLSNIHLKGDRSHLLLNNIKLDNNRKTVEAEFDIYMQKQEFIGKVNGSLDDPDFNLNMQKLLKFQMNKQMDTYMGEDNRKMMESMPMGGTAKDMATDMGGGFMDMFF